MLDLHTLLMAFIKCRLRFGNFSFKFQAFWQHCSFHLATFPNVNKRNLSDRETKRNFLRKMSSGLVLAGLSLAAIGLGGRLLSRYMPKAAQAFDQTLKSLPTSQSAWANSKYYKGGFEPKMSRREAALILGVSPNAQVQLKEHFLTNMGVFSN